MIDRVKEHLKESVRLLENTSDKDLVILRINLKAILERLERKSNANK